MKLQTPLLIFALMMSLPAPAQAAPIAQKSNPPAAQAAAPNPGLTAKIQQFLEATVVDYFCRNLVFPWKDGSDVYGKLNDATLSTDPTEADVTVEIAANGLIKSRLSQSSGIPQYDQQIASTLKQYKSTKPLPNGFPKKITATVHIEVDTHHTGHALPVVSIEQN